MKILGNLTAVLKARNKVEKFLSLLSPELQLYFGTTRRQHTTQSATLTGKRLKRSWNIELVRALFRLVKNCVSACWYITVTLSISKQPGLKSYREKQNKKVSSEMQGWIASNEVISFYQCTQIFPTTRYSWVVYMIQAYEIQHRTMKKQQSGPQTCSPKYR